MTVTGGELITRALQAHGVGTVFAVAGASHTHLLDPLERAGVRIVSNRHEAGAVGGADGYARASGGLGVALIVADQGLPNAVGALAVAWQALSPVLVLVATPPRVFVEAETAVDQDKLALVTPLSKWARTVPDASRLGDYLQTAIKHARAPRQGPAVLLIPEDLLQAQAKVEGASALSMPGAIHPDMALVREAADLLSQAQRPLIVAGSGAAWSGAGAAIARISRTYDIPVFMNGLGRGVVPEDDELGFSWPYAQPAAREADVVLVIGARLTQRLGLGLPPRFAATAKFIQVDVDTAAFHRNRPTLLPITGDAHITLQGLEQSLAERLPGKRFDKAWVGRALAPRAQRIAELMARRDVAIHPLQLAAAVNGRRPADGIVVADGADIATWLYGALRIGRPCGFMDHYPMGAMGSCTALAVGAAAAERERLGDSAPPVVLVTGDGALGFHPAELHAVSLAGLNLVVIVGNDGAWGTELHGQRAAIGRDVNTRLGQLAYEQLGEVFGGRGLRVEKRDQLVPALDQAFARGGLVVVNVLLDQDAGAELKRNPDVRMILFSDILSGQADLARQAGEAADD